MTWWQWYWITSITALLLFAGCTMANPPKCNYVQCAQTVPMDKVWSY